jgi:hypothetical protein
MLRYILVTQVKYSRHISHAAVDMFAIIRPLAARYFEFVRDGRNVVNGTTGNFKNAKQDRPQHAFGRVLDPLPFNHRRRIIVDGPRRIVDDDS